MTYPIWPRWTVGLSSAVAVTAKGDRGGRAFGWIRTRGDRERSCRWRYLRFPLMSDDETRTVRLTVEVADCGIAGLVDKKELDGYAETPAQSVGIIEVEKARSHHPPVGTGPAPTTIADRDPGGSHWLRGHRGNRIRVQVGPNGVGWVHLRRARDGSPSSSSAGPGTYRIRYHVKGMDVEGTDDAVDDHYLQIWPSPLGDPVVVKATTGSFQYHLDPEKYERSRGE